MVDQYKYIDAIFRFRCNANVEILNTVIVIKAIVSYFDMVKQCLLYRDQTRVFIDTTQESKVSIPALAYIDECFSEFLTKYQSFNYLNGALNISESGSGLKAPYVITII